MKPIISVLISVYNVNKYLGECLDSLSRQDAKEVEFCLVDDGSTDGSEHLLDYFASRDQRARVFHMPNKGTLLARRKCIEMARGDFCIFLDPDDYLVGDKALSKLIDLAKNVNSDITQYPVKCVGATENEVVGWQNWLEPKKGKSIKGNVNIAQSFFGNPSTSWVLWNKLFKSEVLKKALPLIPEEYFVTSEDMLILLLACTFSSSYLYHGKIGYISAYRMVSGITKGKITLEKFRHYAKEVQMPQIIEQALSKLGVSDQFEKCITFLNNHVYSITFDRLTQFPYELQEAAVKILLSFADSRSLLSKMATYFENREEEIVHALAPFDRKVSYSKEKNETIGIFYPRLYEGGVERVISLQIPVFLSLGYKVVLITEEIDSKKEYKIPSGIQRVTIPRSYSNGRGQALLNICQKEQIDILIHHQTYSSKVAFDVLLVKSLGVKTILQIHELTTQDFTFGPENVRRCLIKPISFSYADKILVLSDMEKDFYAQLNLPVQSIFNPILDVKRQTSYNPLGKRVMWIGRLDRQQKQYEDALEIFKLVVKEIPSCTCYIIGSEWTVGAVVYVEKFIKENDLEGKVVFQEAEPNIEKYYERATAVLCTSAYESFSMVIAESKAFSIPLVTYDLPYLTLLKNKEGYISVPQKDIYGAAAELVKILTDSDLAERLSREARETLTSFCGKQNQIKQWSNILTHWDNLPKWGTTSAQLWLTTTLSFISHWNSESTNYSTIDRIKISRYDKLYQIFERFLPSGSCQRKIVVKILRKLYRLIK